MHIHRMITIAMSLWLLQCSTGGNDANVGTPCGPSSEADPTFAGFKVTQETIETGAPGCGDGVCLVNHFQGRVTCPRGQPEPTACSGPSDIGGCPVGSMCVEAATLSPECDPASADKGASKCSGFGGVCDPAKGACQCALTQDCPAGSFCDPGTSLCKTYVCHTAGSCQSRGSSDSANTGKACCTPDGEKPVTTAVCGQCDGNSSRDAEKAVYCSCRCGPAEGEPEEDGADYCECPAGFECHEIRKNLGIGDSTLTGKYCIKQGTAFTSEQQCGVVEGFFDSSICKGISGGN